MELPDADWDGNWGNLCQGLPEHSDSFTLEITHPAGAKGEFEFDYIPVYRSGISRKAGCVEESGIYKIAIPNFSYLFSLGRKTITGAGLTPKTWSYQVDGAEHTYCGDLGLPPCGSVPLESVTVVTEPDSSKKVYRFGVK